MAGLATAALLGLVGCQTDETGPSTSQQAQIHSWEYQAGKGSQIMHSLSPAEISGAKGIFPKGLFAKSTTIEMQAGECLAEDSQYQEMMLNFHPAESGRAYAVVVMPKGLSASAPELVKPKKDFYLEIPIPTPSSVSLTHSLKNLVVVYRAMGEGGMESGIIPANKLKIKGNFVSFKTRMFGSYQALKLLEAAPQKIKTPTDKAVKSLAGNILIRPGKPKSAFAAKR